MEIEEQDGDSEAEEPAREEKAVADKPSKPRKGKK
jgi:hypothetical protein